MDRLILGILRSFRAVLNRLNLQWNGLRVLRSSINYLAVAWIAESNALRLDKITSF